MIDTCGPPLHHRHVHVGEVVRVMRYARRLEHRRDPRGQHVGGRVVAQDTRQHQRRHLAGNLRQRLPRPGPGKQLPVGIADQVASVGNSPGLVLRLDQTRIVDDVHHCARPWDRLVHLQRTGGLDAHACTGRNQRLQAIRPRAARRRRKLRVLHQLHLADGACAHMGNFQPGHHEARGAGHRYDEDEGPLVDEVGEVRQVEDVVGGTRDVAVEPLRGHEFAHARKAALHFVAWRQ